MDKIDRKHITIVGGGYLGAMSALLFSLRPDFKVTLIEKQDRLGGLYNSAWEKNGYHFDYGSRAILELGIPELDRLLFSILPEAEYPKNVANLKEFSFQHGKRLDYSNCLDARVLSKDVFERGRAELLAISSGTLQERCFNNLEMRAVATYGPTLTAHLIRPAIEKLTGLSMMQLDPEALSIHGLQRIIIADGEESKRLKAQSDFNDARVAFAKFDDHESTLIKTYPQSAGLSDFGRRIQAYLEKSENVNLVLEQSVKSVEKHADEVRAVTLDNGDVIPCDNLLWTIPSIFLSKLLEVNVEGLHPPVFRNTVLAHYVFSGDIKTDAYFLYNYDPECLGYRYSFYDNFTHGGRPHHSVTVEVFHDDPNPDLSALKTTIFKELKTTDCIGGDCQIVDSNLQFHRGSWPNLAVDFFGNQAKVNETVIGDFKNLHLLGKANGKHHTGALVHSAYELYQKI